MHRSSEEYQKELKELQDYMDLISSTARLLGYKVSTLASHELTIKHQEDTMPFIRVSIHSTIKIIWLKIYCKGKHDVILGKSKSHKEKVNHLKNLLESL